MNEVIFDRKSGFNPEHFCETGYLIEIVNSLQNMIDEHSIIITMSKAVVPTPKYDKTIVILTSDESGGAKGLPVYRYPTFRTYNTLSHLVDYKNCFPIPLGYNSTGNQMKQTYPDKKISERKYDFVFSSQAALKQGLHGQLNTIQDKFKSIVRVTSGFRQGYPIDEYYQLMGNSKLSFASANESFRYYESMASGCITIMIEELDRWYYEGAPIIRVNHWGEITENFINDLLSKDLDAMQEKIFKYYNEKISPEATAKYITEKVKEYYENSSI